MEQGALLQLPITPGMPLAAPSLLFGEAPLCVVVLGAESISIYGLQKKKPNKL